jgi:transcriptional regulator with XRE-family HTH domain
MPRTQPPDPALGTALRQLRLERELSQEEVSHASDISLGTYGKIERNAVAPGWPTVRAIAKALGVSMQQLGKAVDRQD